MSPTAILAALRVENERCDPAMLERDLERISKSVGRYEPARQDVQERPEPLAWPGPLDLADLDSREAPPDTWICRDRLPCGYATLLAGHGGAGKSTIGLTIAVAAAAGVPCFGLPIERRRVVVLSCEDRTRALHRRLKSICSYLDVPLASLPAWLHVIDLVGHDLVLWKSNAVAGSSTTAAFERLRERVDLARPELVVVDGISDTYGGNINSAPEVKQYVNCLVGLIQDPDRGAVLLLGHVNKLTAGSSEKTSEGYTGTAAWHNSVRARWYLYPDKDEEGNKNGLVLELQKSNLGRGDAQVKLAWDPELRVFAGGSSETPTFDRRQRWRQEVDGIRRSFLAAEVSANSVPSAMQGQRTAYHVLSVYPQFPATLKGPGASKLGRFREVIEDLRRIQHIKETAIRRSNRHLTNVFVLTPT